jgi:cation transport regulator ChaB
MPYKTNSDLLDSVCDVLPAAAQTIFREVYNHVWDEYKDCVQRS